MTVTLTQVLSQRDALRLYGSKVSDLSPRGDLGLGMDPEGPVGFAQIRAYRLGGRTLLLASPLIMSVFGEGEAPGEDDDVAQDSERVWSVRQDDMALSITVGRGSSMQLLRAAGALGSC